MYKINVKMVLLEINWIVWYHFRMKFLPGTSVLEHVTEVSLEAVVGTSLDGDADTFGPALLRIPEAKQSPIKQQ